MAAASVSRPGLNHNTNDSTALLLEGFGGESILEFNKSVMLMDKVKKRTLAKGVKNATFPVVGLGTAKYHTPGENIITESGYLAALKQGERVIYADKMLTSSVLIDKFDEMLGSFDARSDYAKQIGAAIAVKIDQNIIKTVWRGADHTQTALYTGAPIGTGATGTTNATQANVFLSSLVNLRIHFNKNSCPQGDRYVVMTPEAEGLLMKTDSNNGLTLFNRDYSPEAQNSLQQGVIGSYVGFNLMVSNNLPSADDTNTENKLSSSEGNTYTGNFASLMAVAFHRDAVGLVIASDMEMENEYLIEYQATLLVAKMGAGVGVLRPEWMGRVVSTAS